MSIFLYILFIIIGTFVLLTGALSLRVSRKKQKAHTKVTYGVDINKHLHQRGIKIEHGMVINKSNRLEAQSKTSENNLEEMLVK